MQKIRFNKASVNPKEYIRIDIYNKKNRLRIIVLQTMLGIPIKEYAVIIKNDVGIVKFKTPTSYKLHGEIIPPIN